MSPRPNRYLPQQAKGFFRKAKLTEGVKRIARIKASRKPDLCRKKGVWLR